MTVVSVTWLDGRIGAGWILRARSRTEPPGQALGAHPGPRPKSRLAGGGNLSLQALRGMRDPQKSSITSEALDEFIRQLFVCNWVLGQMITELLERARSEAHTADQRPMDTCAYALIRSAISEVVDRHRAPEIESATKLIDEVMDAISDDRRIFPADPAVTTALGYQDSRQRRVRRRRR